MPRFEPHPQRRPAVVSGASSGIGAATAVALAAAGHPVALGARRAAQCEAVAAQIRSGGGEAIALQLDVTDGDSVRDFAATAERLLGPAEILVSCAGDTKPAFVHEVAPEEFARQLDVNLAGAHRLVSAVVPGMASRRRGDVVFISSDVARTPRPRMGGYVASKTGLDGMARVMQMELEGTGVRVGIVRPGPTATDMGSTWDQPAVEDMLTDWAGWGLARHWNFLRPPDVAAAVLAIVSAPRGAHLTLIEIQPQAPVAAAPGGNLAAGGPAAARSRPDVTP
jgi:NAD(P)-dependent dehydrogenase (short-subunit alcohol dehydrogenase family)